MASPIAREEITENIIAIRVSRSYSQRSGKGYEVSFSTALTVTVTSHGP